MIFKKILQKIFKSFFQRIFQLFYGKLNLHNPKNPSDFKVHFINSLEINSNIYEVKKNIYEIDDARIYSDLIENVSIIKDNNLISKASFQQVKGELRDSKDNKVLIEGTPRFYKKVNGSVVSLIQGVSGINYFHFLFDIVSRLKLISQITDLEKIDFFYIYGKKEWQIDILKKFNIPKEKILDCNVYRHIKADKIFVSEHPWYNKGYFQIEVQNIPEWIVFFLKSKFINYFKKFDCSKKIFIDRSDSEFNHCKLINNEQIKEFLFKKGFQSYEVGKLDFLEQIYLFKNAEIIISPHGAALTNLIFCNSNLKLIELIPENHPSKKCERISKILGFKYLRVELENLDSKKDQIGDMEMKIDNLSKIINL